MKRILSDGWFQAFTAIAVMTGMVMAAETARFRPAPPPAAMPAASAPPAAARPSAPAAAPEEAAAPLSPGEQAAQSRKEAAARGSPENLIDAGGLAPAAPAPPEAAAAARAARPAAFPIFQIMPKTRGQWIVSSSPDDRADSPSIARVIYSASNGDVVLIRPGKYAEMLVIQGKSLTFRGTGAEPGAVVLTGAIGIDRGSLQVENLTVDVQDEGGPGAVALYASSAKLSLKNVVARSSGVAVKAEQKNGDEVTVRAVGSQLDGGYADVLVRGRAHVYLKDDRFSNAQQPIVVWRDAHVAVESCRFTSDPASRIYAYEESDASVTGSPTAPRVARERAGPSAQADSAQLLNQGQRAQVRHLAPIRGFFHR